jgi:hypothetical protein
MRKKLLYKKNYCKGCIWLKNGSFCPFKRCVRGFGWIADKKGKEGDKNDEKRDC